MEICPYFERCRKDCLEILVLKYSFMSIKLSLERDPEKIWRGGRAATKEVKEFYVGVVGTFKTIINEWQAVDVTDRAFCLNIHQHKVKSKPGIVC